jgi:hypothetical protein
VNGGPSSKRPTVLLFAVEQSEQRLFLLPIASSESYSLHVFVQLAVCDISKREKYRRREMIRVVFADLKYAERYGFCFDLILRVRCHRRELNEGG